MAGTNDFLVFGTAGGANVISQAAYAALAARTAGFSSGEAVSGQLNKVWRQTAFAAAALGKIISDSDRNALDDGNLTTFVTNLLNALAELVPWRLPAGVVLTSADNTAPVVNSIFCNGAVLLRAGTYAALFAKIGTTFNTGGEDGTEFRLPDLRGVVIRGQDAGRGLDPSRVFGSYQADAIGAHSHNITVYEPDDNLGDKVAGDTGTDSSDIATTASTGGSETRMKNVALQFYVTY